MEKIDYKKELEHLYKHSTNTVGIVEVPQMNFLMIDGKGDPNTSRSFQDAIEALYPLSYALKFMVKKSRSEIDYVVMPLEGLWWAEDIHSFSLENKDDWKWTLMIMQPELINKGMVQNAIEQIGSKKDPRSLPLVTFESFAEGKAVQIMHIGPFSEEGPTVEKVHAFIDDIGYKRNGKHHEIYLSDIRRVAPEKLRTIIRHPIL